MRESNFAFPAQNKACVCISSQLYDRRGTFYRLIVFCILSSLLYSTGHADATATVQLTHPPNLPNLNLPAHPRNNDDGRRPRTPRPHPARVLHLPTTARKPFLTLRPHPPQLPPAQTPARAQPELIRQARSVQVLTRLSVRCEHRREGQRADTEQGGASGDAGRRWVYFGGVACE